MNGTVWPCQKIIKYCLFFFGKGMINLYTSSTPNGHKASVTLEELGLPYETFAMDLGNEDQKKDWYLNICPNGRIPAIVDKEENDLGIFELVLS